jgi:hypothetical protein
VRLEIGNPFLRCAYFYLNSRSYVLKSDGFWIKMESLCANKRDTMMATLSTQTSRASMPSYISIKISRILASKSLPRTIPCILVSLPTSRYESQALIT